MLRPPHKRYHLLHLYAFSGTHPALRDFPDPDFIGCWEEEDLTVLFFHREKPGLAERICRDYGLTFELSATVPYADWGEGRRLRPFRVGPLVLAPVWEEGPADLYYDPGVVFGSGAHPTTQLMLSALWDFAQSRGLSGRRVVDLGCGSGLLTLVAARLGAQVLAVDRNPLCVALARKNLSLNGLSAEVREADLRSLLPFSADLVLANLYKGLLLDLLGLPSFRTASYYLLSGFTSSMEAEIQEVAKAAGLALDYRSEKEGWVCLGLQNPKT
ncbi:50S ribosomal protein L11 methyltransferase [Thermosulfurimonas marina]|nr:50S ribosomal protein L11 methyltransferase [Thermosulfurimonas marina]